MSLPLDIGIDLVVRAFEKRSEEKAWERWLVELQGMDQSNFISFPAYYEKLKPKKKGDRDRRSEEEILQDAESILKMMKKRSS